MNATCGSGDEYGRILCNYVQQEFPGAVKMDRCDLLEALSNVILGTKETRYGPIPPPEHLVELRKTLLAAIDGNKPIPILVPWGSIKADFSSRLDVAELSAVKRLRCLVKSLAELHAPGVELVVRIEDTSGYTLFTLEGDQDAIRRSIDEYSADLKAFIHTVGGDMGMRGQLESEMRNAPKFNADFEKTSEAMYKYLSASKEVIKYAPEHIPSLDEYKALAELGWRGIISVEQRSHYLEAYTGLYGGWSEDMMLRRLALYFGGALTRHRLDMVGRQEHWDRFIQLAFVPPIKGLPEGYNYKYVYWRTLPLSAARTHIPPWRAKGYLKIAGNAVTPKLTVFSDRELIEDLVQAEVSVDCGSRVVNIRTDYVITQ